MLGKGGVDAHLVKFRGRAACDFLGAELTELGLEVDELFFEVVFAFAPELAGADFGGGLFGIISVQNSG